ncbi:helix-turn-helix domain-containing protein [Asticcacaulis taihuensis]|uniref:helix-turn-helix domain-containing protein n=1 Tax=Asticcacaulis taihuensis TaxID=260084 RepID=UPI003F6910BF
MDMEMITCLMRQYQGKHLAQLSGVSEATISRIARGLSDPRASVLLKIIDAMGLEVGGRASEA